MPKTSQNATGQPPKVKPSSCNCWMRSLIFGLSPPAWLRPDRSPFTSAMNTGTPIALNCSASTCSVTVLPVPVAPAMRPWRLAICGSRKISAPALAMRMGSGALIIFSSWRFSFRWRAGWQAETARSSRAEPSRPGCSTACRAVSTSTSAGPQPSGNGTGGGLMPCSRQQRCPCAVAPRPLISTWKETRSDF